MTPQKFVKKPPLGYHVENAPESEEDGVWKIRSTQGGFDILYDSGFLTSLLRKRTYTPEQKIAVRLPDGRLVIPTVKGEKAK